MEGLLAQMRRLTWLALASASVLACAERSPAPEDAAPIQEESAQGPLSSLDSALLPVFTLGADVIRPEVATLAALSSRFGGTMWSEPGDASGDTRLCYRGSAGGRDASVVFGSSSMGGPERSLTFVALDDSVRTLDRGVSCPELLPAVSVRLQGRELQLGLTEETLRSRLGTPERQVGDSLFFSWSREETGPYRSVGAQRGTTITWSVYSYAIVLVTNGRVRAFEVGHSTTY